MNNRSTLKSGFSLVELLVTAALISLVFGGLFASFQSMIALINVSKAKSGATALAVEEIEYIRSLSYSDVGTVAGVPSGLIPQNSIEVLNGITYNKRVSIEYVDDEADGFGGADSNGILADYKKAKVELSWLFKNATSSVSLVTSIVPPGIESTDGGGTIRVNVFDASALPVSNAAVRFYNDTTTTTIDTIRYTNAQGLVYLAGAPAAANYQMTVTKAGYTSDGTIVATSSNPNPTTKPIAVVESAVSTMNFQIDEVSSLALHTVLPATTNDFTDDFVDDSKVGAYASTTRSGTDIILADLSGVYYASGTIQSVPIVPAILDKWQSFDFSASTTASTSVRVSLYYNDGVDLVLVPDADLPGNSMGFTGGPVDIEDLDKTTYNTLALGATLSTIDSNETPKLEDWSVTYVESQSAIGNIDFSITGSKTVGTDGGGAPIYKVAVSDSTDASGDFSLPNINWDAYSISEDESGYQLLEVCPVSPVVLPPNTDTDVTMTLIPNVGNLLRVAVVNVSGNTIPSATVELEQASSAYNETHTASLCGQTAFYGGLAAGSDYVLTVSAGGYSTAILPDVVVSSTSTLTVTLN